MKAVYVGSMAAFIGLFIVALGRGDDAPSTSEATRWYVVTVAAVIMAALSFWLAARIGKREDKARMREHEARMEDYKARALMYGDIPKHAKSVQK